MFFPQLSTKVTTSPTDRMDFSQAVLKRTFVGACYFLLIFPLVEIIDWLHDSAQIIPLLFLY